MPRKKQTKLDIPKTRRHIKQKNKKTVQDDIVQIGGSAKQGSTVYFLQFFFRDAYKFYFVFL